MPNCPDEERLIVFAAGGLPDPDADEIASHVATCERCRAILATERQDADWLAGISCVAGDTSIGDRRDTIRQEPKTTGDLDVHADPPSHFPRIEGYEITREVSHGGQAVVYQAVQRSTKRKVAIKFPLMGHYASREERKRFEREIELVARLRHPHVIQIYHTGTSVDGRPFYVMDYIRGLPIHQYVREKKPALEDLLRLFATVCEAVQYAHQRGIIHRDIKPTNILVDADGQPKVLDFGLAKALSAPVETAFSITQELIGTLPYMSPEQTGGNPDEVDTRTDVYALGVLLYELLTGRYPYTVTGNVVDVLRTIAETPPTPPVRRWSPDSGVLRNASGRLRAGGCPIDDEVETIVLKSLAKERERRYQSAGELARDIRHYLAGEPLEARRDSGWYLLRKTLRRYRKTAGTAAAFVILLLVGLATTTHLWRQSEERRELAEWAFGIVEDPLQQADYPRLIQTIRDVDNRLERERGSANQSAVTAWRSRVEGVLAKKLEFDLKLDRLDALAAHLALNRGAVGGQPPYLSTILQRIDAAGIASLGMQDAVADRLRRTVIVPFPRGRSMATLDRLVALERLTSPDDAAANAARAKMSDIKRGMCVVLDETFDHLSPNALQDAHGHKLERRRDGREHTLTAVFAAERTAVIEQCAPKSLEDAPNSWLVFQSTGSSTARVTLDIEDQAKHALGSVFLVSWRVQFLGVESEDAERPTVAERGAHLGIFGDQAHRTLAFIKVEDADLSLRTEYDPQTLRSPVDLADRSTHEIELRYFYDRGHVDVLVDGVCAGEQLSVTPGVQPRGIFCQSVGGCGMRVDRVTLRSTKKATPDPFYQQLGPRPPVVTRGGAADDPLQGLAPLYWFEDNATGIAAGNVDDDSELELITSLSGQSGKLRVHQMQAGLTRWAEPIWLKIDPETPLGPTVLGVANNRLILSEINAERLRGAPGALGSVGDLASIPLDQLGEAPLRNVECGHRLTPSTWGALAPIRADGERIAWTFGMIYPQRSVLFFEPDECVFAGVPQEFRVAYADELVSLKAATEDTYQHDIFSMTPYDWDDDGDEDLILGLGPWSEPGIGVLELEGGLPANVENPPTGSGDDAKVAIMERLLPMLAPTNAVLWEAGGRTVLVAGCGGRYRLNDDALALVPGLYIWDLDKLRQWRASNVPPPRRKWEDSKTRPATPPRVFECIGDVRAVVTGHVAGHSVLGVLFCEPVLRDDEPTGQHNAVLRLYTMSPLGQENAGLRVQCVWEMTIFDFVHEDMSGRRPLQFVDLDGTPIPDPDGRPTANPADRTSDEILLDLNRAGMFLFGLNVNDRLSERTP